ncbi:MAG TPA: ATPase, T2SS/T4P/T4SS family [Candidatus Eisenbacteria bacterium]|jgi:type IV pilus assembly protein PilB
MSSTAVKGPRAASGVRQWLVEAIRRAGVQDGETLSIPDHATVPEAWDLACKICRLEPETLAAHVAQHFGLEVADLDAATPAALALLPERIARRHLVLPLSQNDRRFVVATADPGDLGAEQDIQFATGRSPIFQVAPPQAIQDAMAERYGQKSKDILRDFDEDLSSVVRSVESLDPDSDIADEVAAAPVVRLTSMLLSEAVRNRASDLHLEPGPSQGMARFRVDGLMRTHTSLPMPALNRVLTRIKIMAGLDIADRFRPQDGHARVVVDGRSIDLRISTVPARESEKAVVRFLGRVGPEKLDDVGLLSDDLEALHSLIGHREGVVAITGPTGSGKTTTLYAMVRELARGDLNIMTVEDPIEYELPGITQIRVDSKRQVTFASALRAILRQDPDVILVGEIRDGETASVALQAAMTGHLVLTTLHTNDAASALRRLLDLGTDRASIAAALRGVVGQRLVRRVCPECALPVRGEPAGEEIRLARKFGTLPRVRTRGCPRCGESGYQGRIPVMEVLRMTPELAELVSHGAETADLRRAATAGGMRPILARGIDRVATAETTLEEIERVIGGPDEPQAASAVPVEGEAEGATPGGRTGGRILVVDDDPVHRAAAHRALAGQGYRVQEAASGTIALEQVGTGDPYSLVLLDLHMPGLGGREVVSCLRAMPKTTRLPIIVATSEEDGDLEVEMMEAGADDYIRKPIDPARLVARVRGALRRAAA